MWWIAYGPLGREYGWSRLSNIEQPEAFNATALSFVLEYRDRRWPGLRVQSKSRRSVAPSNPHRPTRPEA